jgi:L-ascorbate metabolism protein UlaG (beta-lactamase superfamily)
MTTIRRLADSCVLITTDAGTTLLDPGFFTFDAADIDLDSIGDVQRVLITHEHADHCKPEFVRWLLDRGTDVICHSNAAVASLLAPHDIEVLTGDLNGVTFEDVLHQPIPTGATPPNRSYTVDGVLTHPGDSHQPTTTAEVMALPLMAPWTSVTDAVAFAVRLGPRQVFPIHDFFMSASGRAMIGGMAGGVLAGHGIELIALDWGDSFTV